MCILWSDELATHPIVVDVGVHYRLKDVLALTIPSVSDANFLLRSLSLVLLRRHIPRLFACIALSCKVLGSR